MTRNIFIFTLVLALSLANPLSQVKNAIGERIVGGHTAPEGMYPHQVSLRENSKHFCAGSIISANWVLSAAHCTYGRNPTLLIMVVGTNRLNSGGTGYGVSEIINHVGFNQQNNVNDISLLRVYGSIAFNTKVQPVQLGENVLPGSSKCLLSGWGLTSYPYAVVPNDLQHISLNSINVADCQRVLPNYPVYNTNVCTLNEAGQGACKGDSGGPLICSGIQHGIVSWGIPCAKGKPDVFTAVSGYRSWIRSNSGV